MLLLPTSSRYQERGLVMGWFLTRRRPRGCNADPGQEWSERDRVRVIRHASIDWKTTLANYETSKKAPLPCFELILHELLKDLILEEVSRYVGGRVYGQLTGGCEDG